MTTTDEHLPLIDYWLAHKTYPGELFGPPLTAPAGGGSWLDLWHGLVDDGMPADGTKRDKALAEVFAAALIARRQWHVNAAPQDAAITPLAFNDFFAELADGRKRIEPPKPAEPEGRRKRRKKPAAAAAAPVTNVAPWEITDPVPGQYTCLSASPRLSGSKAEQ